MPIATICLLEGRNSEQKKRLIKNVTRSITETLDIPSERVRVILQEMALENYGIAGLPVQEYRKQNG